MISTEMPLPPVIIQIQIWILITFLYINLNIINYYLIFKCQFIDLFFPPEFVSNLIAGHLDLI